MSEPVLWTGCPLGATVSGRGVAGISPGVRLPQAMTTALVSTAHSAAGTSKRVKRVKRVMKPSFASMRCELCAEVAGKPEPRAGGTMCVEAPSPGDFPRGGATIARCAEHRPAPPNAARRPSPELARGPGCAPRILNVDSLL
jgi:hypothetical protein